jgi:glyoxylase-like metal-dependent hydrolase (beta-lactamase superfamily II)
MLKIEQLLSSKVYLVREDIGKVNRLNSLMIELDHNNGTILLDANFSFDNINELYSRIKSKASTLIISHFHTDHSSRAFYHEEKYNTLLYCPIQEEKYFKSLSAMMEDVGFIKLGLSEAYLFFINKIMKFKECKKLNVFVPGSEILDFSSIKVQTIHIPGHSPGHTAFIINSSPKILYVSDIGSHPYYGDLTCDLKEYRNSIDKLEKIYLADNFVLIPSHGNIYLEKKERFFDKIRERIKINEQKVKNAFSKTNPKSIKDLVLERIITPEERIYQPLKELYYLWDGGIIHQHILEFIEKGIIEKVEEKDFLNDKYILI